MSSTSSMSDHSLRLIGVGFGRTGTLTLHKVLTTDFGLRCYHRFESRDNQEDELWCKIAEIDPNDTKFKQKLFDKVFFTNAYKSPLGPYTATVDWPGLKFWRDLVDYYPNAKVILTIRSNPGAWYESISNSILVHARVAKYSILVNSGLIKFIMPWIHTGIKMGYYTCLDGLPCR